MAGRPQLTKEQKRQARDLFKRYNGGAPEDLAARAIAHELVPPEQIPRDLRRALGDWIEIWRRRE
jgi:hypothetical protein